MIVMYNDYKNKTQTIYKYYFLNFVLNMFMKNFIV